MHEHDHGHTQTGSHPHEHEHPHEHGPIAGGVAPEERARALLAYMIDHNGHHASELSDLADSLNGAARKRLLEAIGGFEAANRQLREALDLMKGE